MKNQTGKLLRGGSCLLLALGLTLVVSAEPEGKPDRPAKAGERMHNMADTLALSPEQQDQLKAIMESQREQLKALRDDESLERSEQRIKMREIQEAGLVKIRAMLTPEQQTKFDAMPKPGHHRGDRPAKK